MPSSSPIVSLICCDVFLQKARSRRDLSRSWLAIAQITRTTDAREFIDAVAGTMGLILFGGHIRLGVLAAPLLVLIVSPGFIGDDGRFELTTVMLRFTFPYLLFISLTAFAGGVLNTYGKFAVPAFHARHLECGTNRISHCGYHRT